MQEQEYRGARKIHHNLHTANFPVHLLQSQTLSWALAALWVIVHEFLQESLFLSSRKSTFRASKHDTDI
jgi:hypothetical protein